MCVTHCHRNLIFQVFLFVLCLFLYKVGFERKCVKLLVASKGNVLLVFKGNLKLASKEIVKSAVKGNVKLASKG